MMICWPSSTEGFTGLFPSVGTVTVFPPTATVLDPWICETVGPVRWTLVVVEVVPDVAVVIGVVDADVGELVELDVDTDTLAVVPQAAMAPHRTKVKQAASTRHLCSKLRVTALPEAGGRRSGRPEQQRPG